MELCITALIVETLSMNPTATLKGMGLLTDPESTGLCALTVETQAGVTPSTARSAASRTLRMS